MRVLADWGTTNLRGWLVDDQGVVLARYQSDKGLRKSVDLGFGQVFEGLIESLGAHADTPALISGMVGSSIGWHEVPYTPTPANAPAIAATALPIPERANTWIIGGVNHQGDAGPEVMRGEEVQALGVMQQHPDAHWLCLPGTHTKWVQLENGSIRSFTTYMTGELYRWVTQESLIATQIQGDDFDAEAFALGQQLAQQHAALTSAVFQLRTRFLSGELRADQVASAASGLLIQHELDAATRVLEGTVYLCGADTVVKPYALALQAGGIRSQSVDPEQAVIAGLHVLQTLIEAK